MRTQADLVDQLFELQRKSVWREFSCSFAEYRLSRETLNTLIPPISQGNAGGHDWHYAVPGVSFFDERFRSARLHQLRWRIHVNKSLPHVVLLDQFPEQNSRKPVIPISRVT